MIDTLIKIAAWSSSGLPGRRCWPLPRIFRDCVTASEFRSRPVWRPRSPRLPSIPSMILHCAGRTHGPFVASAIAQRYGLGRAIVESACDGLVAPGTLVAGSFVDLPGEAARTAPVRHRSSAGVDQETHPGAAAQGRRAGRADGALPLPRRVAGVGKAAARRCRAGAIEQLSGYPMPASAVESMILPAR